MRVGNPPSYSDYSTRRNKSRLRDLQGNRILLESDAAALIALFLKLRWIKVIYENSAHSRHPAHRRLADLMACVEGDLRGDSRAGCPRRDPHHRGFFRRSLCGIQ